MTASLGDYVRLDDGRTGQVWHDEPDPLGYLTIALTDGTWAKAHPDSLDVTERFEAAPTRHNHAARLVTARKRHTCGVAASPACAGVITPGTVYVRSVVFPGHASGIADHTGQPQVMRLCQACAHLYDDTNPAVLANRKDRAS